MFLVNSRLGLFSAAASGFDTLRAAPLLPKLRGHFAEFLNNGSLAGLRILFLPTCVGLRYRRPENSIAAFLDSLKSTASLLKFTPHHSSPFNGTDLPIPSSSLLGRALPVARSAYPPVSPHLSNAFKAVQESSPVVHRLRLSSSA